MKGLVDSTSALALASAALYIFGYAYYSSYLLYYALPSEQFMPSIPDVVCMVFLFLFRLARNWWLPTIGMAVIVLILIAIGRRFLRLRKWSSQLGDVLMKIPRWTLILLAYGVLILGIKAASSEGFRRAVDPNWLESHVTIIPKASKEEIRGVLVAYSDGTYAVRSGGTVVVIRKEDVSKVTYWTGGD
jgi:hypothetical protein